MESSNGLINIQTEPFSFWEWLSCGQKTTTAALVLPIVLSARGLAPPQLQNIFMMRAEQYTLFQ